MSALELVGGMSTPFQNGRRLILKFLGPNNPELDRIEFKWSAESETLYWQQGDLPEKNPMTWTKVPQALAVIFLDYLSAGKVTGPVHLTESNGGEFPVALGNAITDRFHKIHELFTEHLPNAKPVSRVKQVFGGKNIHGKEEGERRIFIQADNVPGDCIEVYWLTQGPLPIKDLKTIRELAKCIRKSLSLPVPEWPDEKPKSELLVPIPIQAPAELAPAVEESRPAPEAPPINANVVLPKSFLDSMEKMADAAGKLFKLQTKPREKTAPSLPKPSPQPPVLKLRSQETVHRVKPSESSNQEPAVLVTKIDPNFYVIHNPEKLEWNDDMGLLDFGQGECGEDDIWRIKDACEGVLILGAPGSGKTSGSGFALSQAFLTAGFGGLVLCAKTDEARRWQNLCAKFGRANDCIVINRQGLHCLNALAYETQRPGERIGLTDDLISFFRVLIAIVSKRTGGQANEDFWINSTNQLMRALFDVFLLAEEPVVIDSLMRFVSLAPEKPTSNWCNIEYFGEVISRAENKARTDEDKRILRNCVEYWTVVYPGIAPQTRSGITLGFTAMANALSGRGIHDLISSVTNITPELILSGLIVVLDLPIKECGQGGLLVQAAWKFLFQRAIERRADKGLPTARPVFLWEDEGHLFFSQHDIEFQPTARDCRAAHVIISQSLHNFYQLGHNPHAVLGVFATMNTQFFHANGDLETNKWASEKIGTELTTLVNVSLSSQPKHKPQTHWLLDAFQEDEYQQTSSTSVNQHREKIFQPEEFMHLKKGGDGSCQAVILWVSHQFSSNGGKPFIITFFEQGNL